MEEFRAGPPLRPAAQASLPPSKPLRPHKTHLAVWVSFEVSGQECCLKSIVNAVGFNGPVDGALGITLGGICALVVELFALAQADFHLDAAVLEVERKGNESIALQLALLVQPPDLVFVCQKPPDTQRSWLKMLPWS